MWLLFAVALADTCTTLETSASFEADIERVWDRALGGDVLGARTDTLALQARIPCLDGPLTPEIAAAFHRNRALASLASEDRPGAEAAAIASRRLSPEASLRWAQDSNAYASLLPTTLPDSVVEELTTSLAARVYADGVLGARRVAGQPTLLQVFTPDGRPLDAAWVPPRSPTPGWVSFPPPICEGNLDTNVVVAAARAAQTAFEDLEVEAFVENLEAMAANLPCMDRVLGPEEAAAIHRLEGLRLFIRGNAGGAVRAFQEARVLDPAYAPSEVMVPAESSLEHYWTLAGSASTPPWLPMDVPEGIEVWVDGLKTRLRPATLPTVVQLTTPEGTMLWTRFIPATVPFPNVEAYAPKVSEDSFAEMTPARAVYARAELAQRKRDRRRPYQIVGFSLLAGSAIAFIGNSSFRSSFDDPNLRGGLLVPRQRGVNITYVVSTALLVGGSGAVLYSEF